MGTAEVAELLGVTVAVVSQRMRAGTLPEPVTRLRCGPVWRRSQLADQVAEVERRREWAEQFEAI